MEERSYQTIYLDRGDDVAVMRDWLEQTDAEAILFVIPYGNHELRSLVNLRILERHARNASRKTALITSDPRIIDLCRDTELVTFGSVGAAQRSRWLATATGDDEVAAMRRRYRKKPAASEADAVVPDLAGRKPEPVPRPSARRIPFFRTLPEQSKNEPSQGIAGRVLTAFGFLILLILLAGVLGAVVVLVYPNGTVQLQPAVREISAELTVQANPAAEDIDYATLDIPARLTQVELQNIGQIPPTSTSDVPSEKAQGAVTFANLTDELVVVPISTTLTTGTGTNVSFLTTTTATISSTVTSAQVPVVAINPGPIGNVTVGQLNRISDPVLSRKVNVINEAPTEGGGVAPVGVVTRADKERLWSIVLQQLNQEGYEKLTSQLGEQEFLPPESILVLPLDYTYEPSMDGEETDLLSLQMRAVVRGTVVEGQDANQLALAALQAQVPEDYRLDPLSLQFQAGQVQGVSEEQAVSFSMLASGTAEAQIDPSEVAGMIRGLSAERAQRLLQQRLPLAGPPSVVVDPDWLGRLPWFPFRIQVEVLE